MVYSFSMNQAGSLYQNDKVATDQVGNTEVIGPTTENNTISDISFQQSLQDPTYIIGAVIPQSNSSNSIWPSPSSQSYFDNEKTMVMLERFIRNELFHRLKFISSPEMIAFSWESKSLCQIVCNKFQVNKIEQTRFWSVYSKFISQKLNKKRSEISNIMRKAFKGKISFFNIQAIVY